MDFIVGIPNTSLRHDSIWVIVDRLTKTAHFLPVHTTYNAKKYAEIYLEQIVRLHGVAEPPELFQLKCANDRYTAGIILTHLKWNNPLVCRVSARYNHGSTGSKQVYLARR
jgi:hypothetical protein